MIFELQSSERDIFESHYR